MTATQETSPDIEAVFSGVQETLLITLYGKYLDAQSPKPLLGDRYAGPMLDRLGGPAAIEKRLSGQPANMAGVAVRARLLDDWLAEFLDAHKCATVLHLGCGLDTRALRLQERCGPEVRWLDLDVPEVIEGRRQLAPEPQLPGGYEMVGASVTETAWLDAVPADRPVVAVFEGLSMYLTHEQGQDLVRRVATRFLSGQLLFDVLSGTAVSLLNRWLRFRGGWDVVFSWGVDYPQELETIHDGLRLRDCVLLLQGPGVEELPLRPRVTMYVLSWIPYLRSLFMGLRYEFGQPASPGPVP